MVYKKRHLGRTLFIHVTTPIHGTNNILCTPLTGYLPFTPSMADTMHAGVCR